VTSNLKVIGFDGNRSGLEQEDMRILYSYLTASLLPALNEQDFSTAPLVSSAENLHFGR